MAFGSTNNLNIIDLRKKLNNEDIHINIKTQVIFYDYKNKKNDISRREEAIIVITTQKMEKD